MSRLNSQIAELTEALQLEQNSNSDLNGNIATIEATLSTTTGRARQAAGADRRDRDR